MVPANENADSNAKGEPAFTCAHSGPDERPLTKLAGSGGAFITGASEAGPLLSLVSRRVRPLLAHIGGKSFKRLAMKRLLMTRGMTTSNQTRSEF